jgi:hypothetical protein
MMEPSAVIPNYDQSFPLKEDSRGPRRPSILTVSSLSSKAHSPEPSPTRSRFRQGSSDVGNQVLGAVTQGPFMYVGPQRKRYHAHRNQAPYPLPCGLEELSRFLSLGGELMVE